MDKKPLPPWLKQLWDELTTPPAILRDPSLQNAPSPKSRPVPPPHDEEEESSDEPSESPTDPDDADKKPRHNAQKAERLTRQYFTKKRTNRPVSKPRPKHSSKPRQKPKSVYQADAVPAARSATATLPVKRMERSKNRRPADSTIDGWEKRVVSVEPVSSIWRLTTADGKIYALKEAHVPLQRLRWMANVCDSLYRRGFTLVPHFLKTSTGKPFVFDGESLYYAYEWVNGTPLHYDSMRQLGDAARTLAKFHQETSQLNLMRNSIKPYPLVADLTQKQQDLIELSETLPTKSELDEFDQLVKSQLPTALRQGENALALLRQPEVEAILQNYADGICHLDVTSQNLIVHPNGAVQLIDMELMNYAPRVVDLSHLMRRAMQARGNWSSEVAIIPIVAYNRTQPLIHGEYLLLEALLTFPFRLHRLQKLHYLTDEGSQKGATLQLQHLKKAILMETDRQQFLQSYTRQVTRRKWGED